MVILDAYNVLHAGPGAGVGHLALSRLRQWIAASRYASDHVVLVLDGTGSGDTLKSSADPGLDLASKPTGITEIHAGPGRDADSVIESLLEREDRLGRGRRALVVSSDKRVRAAATAARSKVMASDIFLGKLVEDLHKAHARREDQTGGRPDFAQDGGMDPGRTDYWLQEFGLTGDAAAPGRPRPAEIDEGDLDMGKWLDKGPREP
jgi:hypothetical protein